MLSLKSSEIIKETENTSIVTLLPIFYIEYYINRTYNLQQSLIFEPQIFFYMCF